MKQGFYFLVLLSILFTGCVKVLNDDLTAKETKLVINSVINPDSIFTVNISRTFNIFDDESVNNLPFIDDAEVKVYEDGKYLFNLENNGHGYYSYNYYPEKGINYTVKVHYDSLKDVNASAVIPEAVPVKSFDTSTVLIQNEYDNALYLNGELVYEDSQDVDNFYSLSGTMVGKANGGDVYKETLYFNVPESDENLYASYSYGYKLTWSDKLTNGQTVTIRFSYLQMYVMDGDPGYGNLDSVQFEFYFSSISEDYFRYLKSVSDYYDSYDGGPFVEPVVIYTNVENGYGIFGSYDSDTVRVIYNAKNKGVKK